MSSFHHVVLTSCAGSASGPTTDPVLIQLQQSFIPAASSMQSSGISHAFYAAPQNTLTSRFISNVAAASLSACQQADSLAMSPLSSCLDDEMDDKQEDG
jgi:hypothetical protein